MNFKSAEERQKWIIEHAQYFTVFRYKDRKRIRHERPTFEEAEALAHSLCLEEPRSRWMIYAVHGVMDTWVKTVAS